MKFGALGEGGQLNYAPTEKTQNERPFFINYTKLFSECTLENYAYSPTRASAIGECAERLLVHSPTALSELKPRISQLIIIQIEKKIRCFLSRLYGMD